MNILDKLQKQPESIKKMILWLILIIVGTGLAIYWVYSFRQKIKEFPKGAFIEELNLPLLEEKVKELPEIEILEELEKLKNEIEKGEGATKDAGENSQ